MTQIIVYLSHDFISLASDKRLTHIDANGSGKIFTDDECKLVSLCTHSCVGYTGIARIGKTPTHEWIATVLADNGCVHGLYAADLLLQEAPKAINRFSKRINHTVFVVVGYVETKKGLLPYCSRISNCYDNLGKFMKFTQKEFTRQNFIMRPDQPFGYATFGVPLKSKQQRTLERNLKRLVRNGSLPKSTLRLICDEIIASSAAGSLTVGNKILGVSIPKVAAERSYKSGGGFMIASEPSKDVVSFVYLEEGYNEMVQYGPTVACGNSAFTSFTGTRSADSNVITSSIKFLVVPK